MPEQGQGVRQHLVRIGQHVYRTAKYGRSSRVRQFFEPLATTDQQP